MIDRTTPREPMVHELKCWPPYFGEVYIGRKTFEVRLNDRDYRPLDELRLREWSPAIFDANYGTLLGQGWAKAAARDQAVEDAYTGRECDRRIGYMLHGGDPVLVGMEASHAGMAPGYVALSLIPTVDQSAAKREAWELNRAGRAERSEGKLVR